MGPIVAESLIRRAKESEARMRSLLLHQCCVTVLGKRRYAVGVSVQRWQDISAPALTKLLQEVI